MLTLSIGMKALTTEQWVEKAKKAHGDKYDYSKVEYTNTKSKVVITCPLHGEFAQAAEAHLKGCGCSLCGHLAYVQKRVGATRVNRIDEVAALMGKGLSVKEISEQLVMTPYMVRHYIRKSAE